MVAIRGIQSSFQSGIYSQEFGSNLTNQGRASAVAEAQNCIISPDGTIRKRGGFQEFLHAGEAGNLRICDLSQAMPEEGDLGETIRLQTIHYDEFDFLLPNTTPRFRSGQTDTLTLEAMPARLITQEHGLVNVGTISTSGRFKVLTTVGLHSDYFILLTVDDMVVYRRVGDNFHTQFVNWPGLSQLADPFTGNVQSDNDHNYFNSPITTEAQLEAARIISLGDSGQAIIYGEGIRPFRLQFGTGLEGNTLEIGQMLRTGQELFNQYLQSPVQHATLFNVQSNIDSNPELAFDVYSSSTTTVTRQVNNGNNQIVTISFTTTTVRRTRYQYGDGVLPCPASNIIPTSGIPGANAVTAEFVIDDFNIGIRLRNGIPTPDYPGATDMDDGTVSGSLFEESIDMATGEISTSYPSAMAVHQTRLLVGGGSRYPNIIVASSLGDPLNFSFPNPEDATDASPIFIPILIREGIPRVLHIVSSRDLQIYTEDDEYYIPSTDFTQNGIQVINQSSYGSNSEVIPVPLEHGSVFVQAATGQVFFQAFSLEQGGYVPGSISIQANHIITDAVNMILVKDLGGQYGNYLFVLNRDGTIAVLTYQGLDIQAWQTWATDQGFREIFVVDRQLHAVIQNDSGDATIAVYDPSSYMDLQRTYEFRLRTLPFNIRLETGDIIDNIKRIVSVTSTVRNSGVFQIEYAGHSYTVQSVEEDGFAILPADQEEPTIAGKFKVTLLGRDRTSQITIIQNSDRPLHIFTLSFIINTDQ